MHLDRAARRRRRRPRAGWRRSRRRPRSSARVRSSAQYMVGTPAKNVTCSRSISASASPGSNRGISTTVAPAAKPGVHVHGLPEGVEQRQHASRCRRASASAPNSRSRRSAFMHHVAVAELGALGLAGGAAGVEDDRGVVSRGRHGLERRRRRPAPRRASRVPRSARRPPGRRGAGRSARSPAACSNAGPAPLAQRQLGGALEAEVRLGVGVVQVVGDLRSLSSTFSGTTVAPALRMP